MNEKFIWEDHWNSHLVKITGSYTASHPIYIFIRQWMLLSPITIVSFFNALESTTWIDPVQTRKVHKRLKRYSKQEVHSFLALYFFNYLHDFAENKSLHSVLKTWNMTPYEFSERCLSTLSIEKHKQLSRIWNQSVLKKESFYHTVACLEWLGIRNPPEPAALLFEELKTQLYQHFDHFFLKITHRYQEFS